METLQRIRAKLFSGRNKTGVRRCTFTGIPDQCIGFFCYRGMPSKIKFWDKLIRYSSPTRYQELFWGNTICINCVDNGRDDDLKSPLNLVSHTSHGF